MNFKETHFLCFLCVCTINLEGYCKQTIEKGANPICRDFYYSKTTVGTWSATIDGRTYMAGCLNLINQTHFGPVPERKVYFYQQQILTGIDESSEITSISKRKHTPPLNTAILFIDRDLESSNDHFWLTEDFHNASLNESVLCADWHIGSSTRLPYSCFKQSIA